MNNNGRNDKLGGILDINAYNDVNNTTYTAIATGATFAGMWSHVLHYNTVKVVVKSDQTGQLYVQQATAKSPTDEKLVLDELSIDYTTPDVGAKGIFKLYAPWYRILFINNGGSDQTYLTLHPTVSIYQ